MELDELLEREGLDRGELMTWAQARAEQLLAELVGQSDELARLLEPATQIDLDAVPVRRVSVAQDLLPPVSKVGVPTVEIDAEPSLSIDVEIDQDDAPEADVDAGTRGRRRVPSTPQPLSASELPPPPEHTRLAEGEPEPMLEHVDTGPIDLGSPEARAMISANSSRIPLVDEPEVAAQAEASVQAEESESKASDDSDDFEIDTLEELDDEELEIVEVEDESDEPEAAPPPPPPPRRPPAEAARAPAPPPPKPDNTVDIDDVLASLKDD